MEAKKTRTAQGAAERVPSPARLERTATGFVLWTPEALNWLRAHGAEWATAEAAEMLGVTAETLRHRMRRLGLRPSGKQRAKARPGAEASATDAAGRTLRIEWTDAMEATLRRLYGRVSLSHIEAELGGVASRSSIHRKAAQLGLRYPEGAKMAVRLARWPRQRAAVAVAESAPAPAVAPAAQAVRARVAKRTCRWCGQELPARAFDGNRRVCRSCAQAGRGVYAGEMTRGPVMRCRGWFCDRREECERYAIFQRTRHEVREGVNSQSCLDGGYSSFKRRKDAEA